MFLRRPVPPSRAAHLLWTPIPPNVRIQMLCFAPELDHSPGVLPPDGQPCARIESESLLVEKGWQDGKARAGAVVRRAYRLDRAASLEGAAQSRGGVSRDGRKPRRAPWCDPAWIGSGLRRCGAAALRHTSLR